MAKARLRRGIEIVKLANRIESLKMQEDEADGAPGESDVPADAKRAAGDALAGGAAGAEEVATTSGAGGSGQTAKPSLSKIAKGAIFKEVVLAKVREMKEAEAAALVEKTAQENAKRQSMQ